MPDSVDAGDAAVPWHNEIRGVVTGPVVQAHTITGDVVFHGVRSRYRLEQLSWPEPDALAELPLSQLLAVQHGVVEFTARTAELDILRRWRDEQPGSALLLVHGRGGQGKTRLMAEFAAECRGVNWDVLTARQVYDVSSGAVAGGGEEVAGRLVVVDYADRWPVEDLLALSGDPLLADGIPVRLLLVARSVEWWAEVRHEFVRCGFRVGELRLGPLATDVAFRRELFDLARDRFAAVLGVSEAGRITCPTDLDGADFGLVLAIHMAALVAVDAYARGHRPPDDPVGISAYLLDRERAYWHRVADGKRISIRMDTMARAVFVAVLTRPLPYDVAVSTLDGIGVSSSAEPASVVVAEHRICYPAADQGTVLEPLYPDRLAEDFLALLVPGHDVEAFVADAWAATVPGRLLTGEGMRALPGVVRSTLTMLVEAGRRWPHLVRRQLDPLLRANPQLVLAAGGAVLVGLAELDDLDPSALAAVEPFLPKGRHVELDVGIAAFVERLTQHRIAETGPATRAVLYAVLGERLSLAGRFADAQMVTREAVRIRRVLADTLPGIFRPELARSLVGLGMRFAEARQWSEGLSTVEEAITIYRSLPAPALGEFASALDLQGACLAETGRYEEALSAEEEAVRVCRTGNGNEVDLAELLHNLAIKFGNLGRYHESLAVTGEVLDTLRPLARTIPQEFNPKLALALNNGSNYLSGVGRDVEALDAAREAVTIYRSLVEVNPAAFRAELARALHTLGRALWVLGRTEETLAVSAESVSTYRELADAAEFAPGLALTLDGLAQDLSEAGRHGEAEAAATEALEIHRELEERNPTLFRPRLAGSLVRLSQVLASAGQHDRAVAPAAEAVAVYRVLQVTDAATFVAELAAALNALGNRLSTVDRKAEAVVVTSEAVTIFRTTKQMESLAGALRNLAAHQIMIGNAAEALAAAEESVSLYRDLVGSSSVHELDLAWLLSNMGVYLQTASRIDEARRTSEEAIRIYRRLAEVEPEVFLSHLARSLKNLSVWQVLLDHPQEALTSIEEAVSIAPSETTDEMLSMLTLIRQLAR